MPQKLNAKGSALIQILLVLVVLSILGTVLLALSTTEIWQGERSNKRTQAYYYARSGIEMVQRLYNNNMEAALANTPFYLYGSLDSITTQYQTTYPSGSNPTVEKSDILTTVVKSVAGTSTTVTVTSTGNVQGVKKTEIYTFIYTSGGSGEPQPPPIGNNLGDGVSGGPDGMEWCDNYGILLNRVDNLVSNRPVLFNIPGAGSFVYNKDNGTDRFTAPQIYFLNTPMSVQVKKNMDFELSANFLSFKATILGERSSRMLLYPNTSKISGSDISGGNPLVLYGIIYLGNECKIVSNNTALFPTTTKKAGFYFFPQGVNLLSAAGVNSLIRIDNINALPPNILSDLGTVIKSSGAGGVVGEYQ